MVEPKKILFSPPHLEISFVLFFLLQNCLHCEHFNHGQNLPLNNTPPYLSIIFVYLPATKYTCKTEVCSNSSLFNSNTSVLSYVLFIFSEPCFEFIGQMVGLKS